jgi:peroxidase
VEARNNIPAPFHNITVLQTLFGNQGLDLKDLVLLSGILLHSTISLALSSFCLRMLNHYKKMSSYGQKLETKKNLAT